MTPKGHSDLMAGRTVLVTGSTGGIGLATATTLAAMGARVGLNGRDQQRTAAAAAQVHQTTGAQVDAFAADLSSQAGVRDLATRVTDTYPWLDVLINNLGGFWATRQLTVDGIERTLAVNHLAPFLLTHLLAGPLRAAPAARVVTVSSGAQNTGRINLDDLGGARAWSGQRAYNQSKLANVMFTYELARRWADTAVAANVGRPGVVRTAFGHEDPTRGMRMLDWLVRPFMQSPQRGASTFVHLAASPDVAGVTGVYFANSAPHRSSARSYDQHVATRLWRISAELVEIADAA